MRSKVPSRSPWVLETTSDLKLGKLCILCHFVSFKKIPEVCYLNYLKSLKLRKTKVFPTYCSIVGTFVFFLGVTVKTPKLCSQ